MLMKGEFMANLKTSKMYSDRAGVKDNELYLASVQKQISFSLPIKHTMKAVTDVIEYIAKRQSVARLFAFFTK